MKTNFMFKKYGQLDIDNTYIYYPYCEMWNGYEILYMYYSENNNQYGLYLEKDKEEDKRIFEVITEEDARRILLNDLNK